MDISFINASLLIHLASLLYVIAFIVRNQLLLRALGYYFFVPEVPLWDAIAWSVILGGANVYIMILLIMEKTTFQLTDNEKKLYDIFHTINPGEFRRLLKVTRWHETNPNERHKLTTEGDACHHLYFVFSGDIQIQKADRAFNISGEKFIGEVSYFLDNPASASVTIHGGHYVSWEHSALKNLTKINPGIRVALQLILNKDMAHKIAIS